MRTPAPPPAPSASAAPARGAADRESAEPALLSGTSAEYLGRRPLPRVVRDRRVLLLMGPSGVGKSAVARRIVGGEPVALSGIETLAEATQAVARRAWSEPLITATGLILDLPPFLERRPGFNRTIGELVLARLAAGLRTALISPEEGGLLHGLTELIPCEERVTVLLRFPVGRGRRRHALRLCKEMGLSPLLAAAGAQVEPWTWAAARAALQKAAVLPLFEGRLNTGESPI